jgi:dihydrofolate reductase
VAASLDGYIADTGGGTDWVVMNPAIDFAAKLARFDTFLMGRATYERMVSRGADSGAGGMTTWVFSRTLHAPDHPDVTVISGDVPRRLAELRSRPGKEIALFGGGKLFRSLLELGWVDVVEVAVLPVLLGGGVPLLPSSFGPDPAGAGEPPGEPGDRDGGPGIFGGNGPRMRSVQRSLDILDTVLCLSVTCSPGFGRGSRKVWASVRRAPR